jgi:predicted RNase H-like nuclease (RuvC/YqgF family)
MKSFFNTLILAAAIVSAPFVLYKINYRQNNELEPVVNAQRHNIDALQFYVIKQDHDFEISIKKCNSLSSKVDELTVINNKLRANLKEKDDITGQLEKEIFLQRTIIEILQNQQEPNIDEP